jgi:hypothetical protein
VTFQPDALRSAIKQAHGVAASVADKKPLHNIDEVQIAQAFTNGGDNSMTSGVAWTDDEGRLLTTLWENVSKDELIRAFPTRSWKTLVEKARLLGLPGRLFERRERYSPVNQDFFVAWSEAMSYVFGFWFADGWMSQPDKDAQVSFVSKDKEHLDLIRELMESQHRIYSRLDACFALTIGGKRLWRGLSHQGGMPAKSLTAPMPYVPQVFLRHFVRGYVDGDGYVVWETSPRRRPVIGILGGTLFLVELARILDQETGVGVAEIRAYDYLSPRVVYSGIKAKALSRWLYADTAIALERKAMIARQFAEWEPSKFGWKSKAVLTSRMRDLLAGSEVDG